MSIKSCAFIGHRKVKYTQHLKDLLQFTLEFLINDGITEFYSCGEPGWDIFCAAMVIKLREKYPHIQLHMLLPCSQDEQTAGWWSCEKEHYYRIINHADSVEYVSNRYRIGCIKKRNARLIELASIYVCYYDEDRIGGRTEHIMRMVRRNGLHIFNHM